MHDKTFTELNATLKKNYFLQTFEKYYNTNMYLKILIETCFKI